MGKEWEKKEWENINRGKDSPFHTLFLLPCLLLFRPFQTYLRNSGGGTKEEDDRNLNGGAQGRRGRRRTQICCQRDALDV